MFATAKLREKADAIIGRIKSKCQCCSKLFSKFASIVWREGTEKLPTKHLSDVRRRKTVRSDSQNHVVAVEMKRFSLNKPLKNSLNNQNMQGDKKMIINPVFNIEAKVNVGKGRARSKTESSALTFKDSRLQGKIIKGLKLSCEFRAVL